VKGREQLQECVRLAITSVRWSLRWLEIGLNRSHVTADSELARELRRAVAHSRAAIDSLDTVLNLLEPPEADAAIDTTDELL
jgi:hypothetical protein